ncbi:MAG: cobalt transporter, partial [Tannerella sp.]|nr:cobalt transporter [Tannerella sp.]
MKTILDLSSTEIRRFFLKQEIYCEIDLPKYFVFNNLLDELSKSITATKLSDIWIQDPKSLMDVNYTFYTNKDGEFAWR